MNEDECQSPSLFGKRMFWIKQSDSPIKSLNSQIISKVIPQAKKYRIFQYSNGDTYEGSINTNNQRDGYGVFVCSDRKRTSGYEYHGNWVNNLRHGKEGRCFYYNEEFYIGDWMNDQRHGQGEHFYFSKYSEERYLGEWRFDQRHGKGVMIKNGGQSHQLSGGGQEHYEGKFKDDVRHGRGILKMTFNHHKFSTKAMEVKIYEQEWWNGKLMQSQILYQVEGEETIRALLLSNDFITYQTYDFRLLKLFNQDAHKEINFKENLALYSDQNSLNINTSIEFNNFKFESLRKETGQQTNSKSKKQDTGLTMAKLNEQRKQQLLQAKEQGKKEKRDEILKNVIGYQKYLVASQKKEEQVNKTQSLINQVIEELEGKERDALNNLNYQAKNEPLKTMEWKNHQLISYLLFQDTFQIDQVITAFLERDIDGSKFFRIKSEAEMLEVTGIKPFGIRKILMMAVRKVNQAQQKIEMLAQILRDKDLVQKVNEKKRQSFLVSESGLGEEMEERLLIQRDKNFGERSKSFSWTTNVQEAVLGLQNMIINYANKKKHPIDGEERQYVDKLEFNNMSNQDVVSEKVPSTPFYEEDFKDFEVQEEFQKEETNNQIEEQKAEQNEIQENVRSDQETFDKDSDKNDKKSLGANATPNICLATKQQKMMSQQSNELFMNQVVGNLGKIQGINIKKIRESSALRPFRKKSPSRKTEQSESLDFENPVNQRNQFDKGTNLKGNLTERSKNRSNQGREMRNYLNGSQEGRKRERRNKSTVNSVYLCHDSEVIQTLAKNQKQKQRMTKNLIEILFQTEKDKQIERLKKEKLKLLNNDYSRGNSKGATSNQVPQGSRGSSRGFFNPEVSSNYSKKELIRGIKKQDGKQISKRLSPKMADDSEKSEYVSTVDQDALRYLMQTFNENGFSFYIDFNDLKYDYKTDFQGQGGYGEVFRACWQGIPVAVKRFGRKCVSKKNILDFVKEIEIVNQMRHPNIIFYMGVSFDDDNHYYMVTEFASKGSIFDILHSSNTSQNHQRKPPKLDDKTIFSIIGQMAQGVEYLHQKKILHCDLKSQNILVTDDWCIKICDFGLSRYTEKFVRENVGKVGTPHWMAPEILRGETYSQKSDVFSFGIILWELLTGDIPHRGRSVQQIVGNVGYHFDVPNLKNSTQIIKEKINDETKEETEKLQLPGPFSDSFQMIPGHRQLKLIYESCTNRNPSERPSFQQILGYMDFLQQQVEVQKEIDSLMKDSKRRNSVDEMERKRQKRRQRREFKKNTQRDTQSQLSLYLHNLVAI